MDVPKKLPEDEEVLVRQWADLRGDDVAAAGEAGIFDRIRSAFQ